MSLDNGLRTLPKRWAPVFLLIFSICLLFAGAQTITSQPIDLSSSSWATAILLPRFNGLSRHVSVVHNGIIYVIGGADSGLNVIYPTIYTATILDNARINLWNSATVTEMQLAYPSVAVTDIGQIYVTGGYNGNNALSTTYIGELIQSGYVNWQRAEVTRTFRARYTHASVISGNKIFVIGGWDQGRPFPDVDYAVISTTGAAIDGWNTATVLNPPRAAHAAVEFEGRIYVIGGTILDHGNLVATNTVDSAVVTNNGLTSWTRFTSAVLPRLDYHSAVILEPMSRIYVIGGRIDRKTPTSKTFWADIRPDGTLTEWTEDASLELPLPLYRHTAAYGHNGSIYVIGGQTTDDSNQSGVYYIPPLTFTKSADPPGPVHEGDIINYTLSYANTSLIPQTMTITDALPFNLTYIPDSADPPPTDQQGSTLIWRLNSQPPGASGQIRFKARVPLLPPSPEVSVACPTEEPPTPTPTPPDYIVPVPVACDTTRFWANGVTYQSPSPPVSHTIHIQIPPGTNPTALWLLMKGTDNTPPEVDGQPAQPQTGPSDADASLWTADITPTMIENRQVTVVTYNPRQLNAVYLFNQNDPPFDESKLSDVQSGRQITYALEIPTVATQTIDVILPLMNVTYWTDDLLPTPYLTTVTVQFDDQPGQTVIATMPNMGNGLLMTQFPFSIGPLGTGIDTATKVLTVTVDTQDDIYTLGPRICRPVRVENTAWLCSEQAGCISSTVIKEPERPITEHIYLPILLKSSP